MCEDGGNSAIRYDINSAVNIEGNAIDYFVLVEGKSFRQAMDILSAAL